MAVRDLVRDVRVPLLFGSDQEEDGPGGPRLYNAAFMLGPAGNTAAVYRKINLVPWGEFIPLKRYLYFVSPLVDSLTDFSPGTSIVLLPVGSHLVSTAICYEVVFPGLIRQAVNAGSELLTTITNDAWWAIALSPQVPTSTRFTVVTAVLLAVTAIWWLVRPGRVRFLAWDDTTRRRLIEIGGAEGYHAAGFPADGVVLGESQRAAIPFRRTGPVLLGLGDPVGNEQDRVSAIWRLRDLAHQEGLHPAFWRIGPGLLEVYGDVGLTPLPLGPDGSPIPPSTNETVEHYLACVAETDLSQIVPLLPRLADWPDQRST